MRQTGKDAPWYRSMLFVPGQRLEWLLKAPRFGADALIFDLEDAVPVDHKTHARSHVAQVLNQFREASFGRFARVNPWGSGRVVEDLLSIVRPGLDGVLLPKTEDAEDIVSLDALLTELEIQRDLPVGKVEIFPLCETALGKYRQFDICRASPRVKRAMGAGGFVPDGDSSRALNLHSLEGDGREEFLMNLRSGLDARAAGVTQVLGGMTTAISDLDLVRRLAERARSVGATGSTSIHPSHVPIHNDVFSPSQAEIAEAKTLLHAMAAAIAKGDAAASHQGRMIDYAHVRSSMSLLRRAEALGVEVGDVPAIDLD